MRKQEMEVPANELVRGNDDSGAGNERSGGGACHSPIHSRSDGSTEARAIHLQLQGRGSGPECTGESAGAEAKPIDSDPSAASTADRKPQCVGPVPVGWRSS